MTKKIMLVEDNLDLTYVVKRRLEKMGNEYEIIGAPSWSECLKLLTSGIIPDLILLDIMLPELNGWDIFAKLQERSEWRSIPVIFLTAKKDQYSKGFGELAASDYIEKPFEIANLKMRIDKILQR